MHHPSWRLIAPSPAPGNMSSYPYNNVRDSPEYNIPIVNRINEVRLTRFEQEQAERRNSNGRKTVTWGHDEMPKKTSGQK